MIAMILRGCRTLALVLFIHVAPALATCPDIAGSYSGGVTITRSQSEWHVTGLFHGPPIAYVAERSGVFRAVHRAGGAPLPGPFTGRIEVAGPTRLRFTNLVGSPQEVSFFVDRLSGASGCAPNASLARPPAPSAPSSPRAVVSRPAAQAPVQRTLPAWFVGRWGPENGECVDFRADGSWVHSGGSTGRWHFEGSRFFVGESSVASIERIDDNRVRVTYATGVVGINYRCRSAPATAQPSPAPPRLPAVAQPQPPATATVRVRLAGYYGTRCVTPSIRNVRRPAEPNPHPTSWIGDWTLTNNCPVAQWVRIETDGAGHLFWSGLQTPGARMGPNPNLVPSLPFQPIREHDFQFGWLVPANSDLVTGTAPVHQGAVDNGLDVWIASCDAVGDARRQAIYLSAPFRSSPRVACYNHALPNGGIDQR